MRIGKESETGKRRRIGKEKSDQNKRERRRIYRKVEKLVDSEA
jgi:hypothetical protein